MTDLTAGAGFSFRQLVATTPALIRTGAALCTLAALLFAGVTADVTARTHDALHTIALDTEPSVVAAKEIDAALSDLEAGLLARSLASDRQSRAAFDQGAAAAQEHAVADLEAAIRNQTYEAEWPPLNTLSRGMLKYAGLAATLPPDGGDAGPVLQTMMPVLHDMLLPAGETLAQVNDQALEQAYAANRTAFWVDLLLMGATGALALGTLVGFQILLGRRTRRVFNLPLASATLALGVLMLVCFVESGRTEADIRTAKADAYDSVKALESARAAAYEMNSYESYWLLDKPAARAKDQARFATLADAMFRGSEAEAKALAAGQTVKPAGQGGPAGALADELRNITFEGERDAAATTLGYYRQYLAIDTEIRRLDQAGQHDAAVALCLGVKPGQSNAVFAQFDAALGKTLDINKQAVERMAQLGLARALPIYAALLAGVIAVALGAVFGIRPVLRPYGGR
jgi:hypothetical protein